MIENILQDNIYDTLKEWDFYKKGEVVEVTPYGRGHINDTFRITMNNGGVRKYIIQRINQNVFKNPVEVMENIVNVTEYLKEIISNENGDPERETLTVLDTIKGKPYAIDSKGEYWRAYYYIDNTICLQQVEQQKDFHEVGRAFGNFQKQLSDFPVENIYETINDFHDTRKRFHDFLNILHADKHNQAKNVKEEIDFVLSREDKCGILMDLQNSGEIPIRVTHNDTKLNNILLDKDTVKAVCVIDLDTIMPGQILTDYGDAIRFGANTAAEDEKDLSKVNFDFELFDVFTDGFISVVKDKLTKAEKEHFYTGAYLMTLECGIRFLSDYLDGDNYFKISYPEHNVDRCRTQFKLVSEMEKLEKEMIRAINKYL